MRTWGGGMLSRKEASGAHVDPRQPIALLRAVPSAWGLVNAAIASFEVSTKIIVGSVRSGQEQGYVSWVAREPRYPDYPTDGPDPRKLFATTQRYSGSDFGTTQFAPHVNLGLSEN
jgi:hypothetical protein